MKLSLSSPYFTRRLLMLLPLYFASGLPLALTAGTLAYWLSEAHVDKAVIGLFAFVGLPYSLKFVWAPLMDTLSIPLLSRILGHRRGWIVAVQVLLMFAILLQGVVNPETHPWEVVLVALLVAFASASQDIVIDAYRIEILKAHEQGEGAAMAQLGYRLGMIMSGAGALFMATRLGWSATYMLMSLSVLVGMVTILFSPEPTCHHETVPSQGIMPWLQQVIVAPFAELTKRERWWLVLLFVVLFHCGDAYIGRMLNPFLHEIGFTKDQVATVVKLFGTGATIAGTFIGGALVARYNVMRVLMLSGIALALANLLYGVQALVGPNVMLLAAITTTDYIISGIMSAAFVAYLSRLCNAQYTATQYSLLSSFASLGRTALSSTSGAAAAALGWFWFFIFCGALAMPGLVVLYVLSRNHAVVDEA